MKKLIALYSRSATDDKEAIDKQMAELTKYCADNNIEDFKHYVDNNQSGISRNRPALNQLIKDLRANEIGEVIVTDIARLSRDMHNLAVLLNSEIEAHGAKLITLDNGEYRLDD